MTELTGDGYFKLAKEYQVVKPFDAYYTAGECIDLLASLQGRLDKDFLIDMLSSLKNQIDTALESVSETQA